MFPSYGLFKNNLCPDDSSNCNRPYCPFHHAKIRKKQVIDIINSQPSTDDISSKVNNTSSSKSDASQTCSRYLSAEKEVNVDSNSSAKTQMLINEKTYSSVDEKEVLQKLISDAVKKAIAETTSSLNVPNLDHNSIIQNLDANSLIAKAMLEVTKTSKPVDCIGGNSKVRKEPPKLYLPPPGTPNYMPTPISELKRKRLPIHDPCIKTNEEEYTPTSIVLNSLKEVPLTSDLVEESEITDFSSSDNEECDKSDFDMLEEVLAEHSSNPIRNKEIQKRKKALSKIALKELPTTLFLESIEKTQLVEKHKVKNNEKSTVECIENSFLPPSPLFTSSIEATLEHNILLNNENIAQDCLKSTSVDNGINKNLSVLDSSTKEPLISDEKIDLDDTKIVNCLKESDSLCINKHTLVSQIASLTRPNTKVWTPIAKPPVKEHNLQSVEMMLEQLDSFSCVTDTINTPELSASRIIDQKDSCKEQSDNGTLNDEKGNSIKEDTLSEDSGAKSSCPDSNLSDKEKKNCKRKRSGSSDCSSIERGHSRKKKRKKSHRKDSKSKKKYRKELSSDNESYSTESDEEEENRHSRSKSSKRNKHKSRHYRKKKGHKHKKRKDKKKRIRSSDRKQSYNSNTDSNSKEDSTNSEGNLPIDPAYIKKEKEEDLDVFIVKVEKPDKVPNSKINPNKISRPTEKLLDTGTQVIENISKSPVIISNEICDTQKENKSDSSKTNSKAALRSCDDRSSTKTPLSHKIKSSVTCSKDISSKTKQHPNGIVGKCGERVHDDEINKECSLNNNINKLLSKAVDPLPPHQIKIEKHEASTLSISPDVPKLSMFDVVTAKLEQITKPKVLSEISLFDSLLDCNSQVKKKNFSNPTSSQKSNEKISTSNKKSESNIKERSSNKPICKKSDESSTKEKYDIKHSNHSDYKNKIKNNPKSDKYKLANASKTDDKHNKLNQNVSNESNKSKPNDKVKKDCSSTKSSLNVKKKEGESTKSSQSSKKKGEDVKINAENTKSRTKSKVEVEKRKKDENHSKHSYHESKKVKKDSTVLVSTRDKPVSDSHHKSSSSSSHRKHSSCTSVPQIASSKTKHDSKRRHSESSRRSSSSIVSNNEDISDGYDSPIPDLSALDELPKEDWDQLLSCNMSDSLTNSLRKDTTSDSDEGIDYESNFGLDENVNDAEDANDPKVVEECMKLFSEFDSDNVSQPFKKTKVEPLDLKEEPEVDASIQKQRVARTGAAGNLLSTPKPLVRPHRKTPAEVMLERYKKLKEEEKALQKKLELQRKALEQHTKTPYSLLSSTPSISNSSVSSSSDCKSAMLSSSASSSTIGVSKKRIARAPSNVEAMLRSKAEINKHRKENSVEVTTSSVPKPSMATVAMTSSKGSKRVAHVPTPEVLVRPTVNIGSGTKVPQNIRQRYLNCFIDEASKFCENTNQAYKVALAEEKVCHQRATTRMVYLNLAVNIIKKLRSFQISEAAQEILNVDPEFDSAIESSPKVSSSSSSSQVFNHPINPNHRVVSHLEVISAGGNKGTWSIQKSKKPLVADLKELLSGPKFSKCLKKYILTVEQLEDNGFPRPDPNHRGKAIIKKPNSRKKISPTETKRYCDRCSVLYEVDPWGVPLSIAPCVYHWGRPYKKRAIGGGLETKYSCCQGDNQADGCCMGTTHVSENFSPDSLKGYVRTLPKEPKRDGDYGVYALDCEMCYTTSGNELTRITVIDVNKKSVYETLVLPDNPIIDYNTRFSGITVEQMEGVRVSLRDVQATLLTLFSDKTILMGHSLESDFSALKLIHDTVVDTSVVFPHKLGAPYKRALRNLASEILTKIIQNDVAGHDSAEDAITCLELMQWKVQDDFKILTLQKNLS